MLVGCDSWVVCFQGAPEGCAEQGINWTLVQHCRRGGWRGNLRVLHPNGRTRRPERGATQGRPASVCESPFFRSFLPRGDQLLSASLLHSLSRSSLTVWDQLLSVSLHSHSFLSRRGVQLLFLSLLHSVSFLSHKGDQLLSVSFLHSLSHSSLTGETNYYLRVFSILSIVPLSQGRPATVCESSSFFLSFLSHRGDQLLSASLLHSFSRSSLTGETNYYLRVFSILSLVPLSQWRPATVCESSPFFILFLSHRGDQLLSASLLHFFSHSSVTGETSYCLRAPPFFLSFFSHRGDQLLSASLLYSFSRSSLTGETSYCLQVFSILSLVPFSHWKPATVCESSPFFLSFLSHREDRLLSVSLLHSFSHSSLTGETSYCM